MKNKLSLLAITLSICSLGLSIIVFSETKKSIQNDFDPSTPQNNTSISSQIPLKQNRAVEISVSEEGFSPSGIHIKPNEIAIISITNAGEKPHSFIIDGSGIDTGLIEPGQTKKIEFYKDIESPESFEFYSNAKEDNKEKITGSISIF